MEIDFIKIALIIGALAFVICVTLVMISLIKTALGYKVDELVEIIISDRAFAKATKGLNDTEIYKQRGSGVRANVQRSIERCKKIEYTYYEGFKNQYIEELTTAKLVKNNNVKRRNIAKAKTLYKKLYDENKDRIKEERQRFLSEKGITPEEFFELRTQQKGDVVGVYVIYNQTKDMYYVGQAKKIFMRVNQHFTGKGNGDVYADYKYGDVFLIRLIKLSESGYDDIDKLERDKILEYDAFNKGYNKTRGNE